MRFRELDRQLSVFADQLTAAVGVNATEAGCVATSIATEARFMEPAARSAIFAASPVPLQDRIQELGAFQSFMGSASAIHGRAAITRAQVIVQNYVCLVYLNEACFRALLKASMPGSVTRRCCKFLTDNPVRAFRNAIAHANWTYASDFGGLTFSARKGFDASEPLSRFEVRQHELDFWQTLSRGVAYAAYTTIEDFEDT